MNPNPLKTLRIRNLKAIQNSKLRFIALNEQLGGDCRDSGNEFFQYMLQRGVQPGLMQRLIQRATGQHPRSLWKVQDAEKLRDAILRYQTALIIAKNSHNDATAIVHFTWEK